MHYVGTCMYKRIKCRWVRLNGSTKLVSVRFCFPKAAAL